MFITNRQRRKQFINITFELKIIRIIVIVLIVFLLLFSVFIITIGKLIEDKQNDIKNRLFGEWNVVISDVDENDIDYLIKHAFIENYSIQTIIDNTIIDNDIRIIIGSCDNDFLNLGKINMLSGQMPTKEKEVAIEKSYLKILGVKQVGDTISNECDIKTLQGYRVSGIIEDYSIKWKMVNWDLFFINCFVYQNSINLDSTENQIFIKANNTVKQDLKLNFVNVKDNILFSNKSYIQSLIVLWFVVIIIILIFVIKVKTKLTFLNKVENIGEDAYYNSKSGKWTNWYDKIYVLLSILLMLALSCLVLSFFDELVFKQNYFINQRIVNSDNNNIFINEEGLIKYIEMNLKDIIDVKEVIYIPDKNINNIVNLVVLLFWIMLVNILGCFLESNRINRDLSSKKELYYLQAYFYGEKILINKFKRSFNYNYLKQGLVYALVFIVKYSYVHNLISKMLIFIIGFIFVEFMVLTKNSFSLILKK